MGAFIYIYIMMDVLVKARTGLLGYFLCVVSVLLLASCGLDLFSSDKDDDKECAETVDKVPLEPGLEALGGYTLQDRIHYIYSDTNSICTFPSWKTATIGAAARTPR